MTAPPHTELLHNRTIVPAKNLAELSELSRDESNFFAAVYILRVDTRVDLKEHTALLRRTASYTRTHSVFVIVVFTDPTSRTLTSRDWPDTFPSGPHLDMSPVPPVVVCAFAHSFEQSQVQPIAAHLNALLLEGVRELDDNP